MRVSGKLCDTEEIRTLVIADGRIVDSLLGAQTPDVGGPDVWMAPGFFDLQINGYGGADFNPGAWGEVSAPVSTIFEKAAQAGTALLCPTITTDSRQAMQARFTDLTSALNTDLRLAKAVPGFHLEGPYIASEDGPRGAHPLEHVRNPDWDEFQHFQEAAEGRIRLCTLAPERAGALPFIEKLTEHGIIAAIGHTGAESETIHDAVLAGATLSTHLGNGAHNQIRRHPNYIWEQLANDDLYVSLIADGHHLPASVVKVFSRAKGPDKMALISDAVCLGGQPAGIYGNGCYEVMPSGKVVLAGTPYLAGSGHLLDTCIANALRFTDYSLAEVIRCAGTVPACILGLDTHKGCLQVGYDADITLFRVPEAGPLEITATLCSGSIVFKA